MDERNGVNEVRLSRDRSGWLIRRDPAQETAWRAEGAWTGHTLADHARAAAQQAPDHVLLIEGDTQVTAAEFLAQATRAAGALIGSGLKPGDVVSFQLPNWREACVLNLAATLSGLIINPIIPIYRGAELVHILTDSRSRMIFVPAVFRGFDYREMARDLSAQIPAPPEVVVLRGEAQEFTGFEAFLARDRGAPMPATASSDLAMALYTSGTTGPAKGVLHTHDAVDVMVRDYERCWGPWKGEALIVSSPITHITGAIQALHVPIQVRATAVLVDIWDPDVGLELVKRHRASYFGGATPFLRDILAKAQAADEHLPSLRIVACGGAAVPPGLMRGCHAQFPNARVFRAYGCTEVPAVTEGTSRRSDIDYGADTDGWIGATKVRLVRPGTDDLVADGEEGEILAYGAQMFVGYSRPEDNDAVFTADGFFRTGDLGRVRDGYLTVTGRLKDLIIRNGENLSAKEIEDALDDMPQVAEVAIVGAPSERTGEAVSAFVVPQGPSPPDVAALAAHLSAKGLARQKFPERVVIASDLPRNAQGKIRKDVLRAEVIRLQAAESSASTEPPSTSSYREEYSRG